MKASALELSPFSSVEALAAALDCGATTALGLAELHLERIAAMNSTLGAFVRTFDDEARQTGDAADALRRSGRPLGALYGIPLAVKDLFHYAGHPTEAGSKAMAGRQSQITAHSVERLERRGMNVLGKTSTVEFAFGGWGTNHSLGSPRNPWDLHQHRIAGGSSNGSAIAVATGMAPAALGTDTGGSVRIPAALCGVVGLKTSKGLISLGGILPLCPTHDSVGPLTRTVRDAALMMQALAGPDANDPATLGAPLLDYLSDIERGVAGMRIAYLDQQDMVDCEPGVRALFEASIAALERLGATLTPLRLPRPLTNYMRLAGQLMSAESYRHLAQFVDAKDSLVHASVRERVLRGRSISASDYMLLLEARHEAEAEVLHALDRIDAFIAPTCPIVAIPLAEVDEDQTPLSAYGRFVNFLDLSALSIPMGQVGGLPAGLQIVARRFDDPLALRIGRALERDAGFAFREPPHLFRLLNNAESVA